MYVCLYMHVYHVCVLFILYIYSQNVLDSVRKSSNGNGWAGIYSTILDSIPSLYKYILDKLLPDDSI